MLRWIAIIGLTIFSKEVTAQYKNIKVDEGSFEDRLTNPAIAIISKDGKSVVATGMGDQVYTSADGGQSWTKSKMNGASTEDRALAVDLKGSLYAVQAISASMDTPAQIVCMSSKDGGKTWEDAVPVASNPAKDQRAASVSIDTKGNLLVTWTQFDAYQSADSTCESVIFLSSSSNGKKWNKPVRLSQRPGDCQNDKNTATGAVAAVGPDGKIFASWYSRGKILMDRSFGSGMWLENDILVGNQTSWSLKIPGHTQAACLPSLMVDQTKGSYHGCIYLVWADERNRAGDSDVSFMRSNNHGDNWSSPLNLGNVVAAKHQYAPKMTIDQVTGFIYVVFYDRGAYDDEKTDVSLAYSSDSGANFKTVKISESPFTPDDKSAMGTYLNIAAHNGTVIPIWSRMDNGITSLWTTTIKQDDLIKPPDPAKGKKKK